MSDIQRKIGQRIKYFRAKRGLTQEELANRAGLHTTFIAHIETGKKICSIKSLVKIAAALKVPPYILLTPGNISPKTHYDPPLERLIHEVREKNDADKDLLLSIAKSMTKRSKKD